MRKHPLAFSIIVTLIFGVVMTLGVLFWGWEPGDWDFVGM